MPPSGAHDGTHKVRIYRDLRRAIIMGRRTPGDRIDAREESERYGTSITPVREALQMLDQEGLVEIRSHSGYLVTRLTLKQLSDLFDLREILELAGVDRAVERITEEQIDQLEQVYAGYTGDDDESYARYTAENREFHVRIAQAGGNAELAELLGHLHDRLARFMVVRHAGQTMQFSHRRIIEGLRSRNRESTRRALLEELLDTRQVVLERVIQEQGDAWELDR
jgi:DNA-binding GntR family transcriptional regulator